MVRFILNARRARTFFFRSTRFSVSVSAITVSATNSLYEISSVAVNVDNASRRSSPPRLNWRMETRYRPLYTLRRLRLSQSPPSSISLEWSLCQFLEIEAIAILYFSALEILDVTISVSLKNKPILTRERMMSIREPRPGVFSNASLWASNERSWFQNENLI